MKEEKTGYITLTYRQRFYDKHLDWLWNTKVFYNQVVEHYYKILMEHIELLDLSSYYLMRELEVMTIGTKEMKQKGQMASYPFNFSSSVPLYFRRAAINSAISLARSVWIQKQTADRQLEQEVGYTIRKENFSVAPVYYKGMYQDLTEQSIRLKVFTGEKWIWNRYRFCGHSLPKDGVFLSPVIYLEKKQAYLHVPVKKMVSDIRTVKERMQTENRVLAVSFPGSDTIAVAVVMAREGNVEQAKFFHGGLELKAKKKQYQRQLKKVKKKQKENGQNGLERTVGERYRKKIRQVNTYYAHLISRRILEFGIEQKIKVIVVPNYQRAIDFSKKQYLETDGYEWIGRKMIRFLKYKAFSEGILVSSVPVMHISDCCSECGAKIKRYNEEHTPGKNYFGGRLFLCPNGHQGNSGFNTAKNVGKRFFSYYEDFSVEKDK